MFDSIIVTDICGLDDTAGVLVVIATFLRKVMEEAFEELRATLPHEEVQGREGAGPVGVEAVSRATELTQTDAS